MGEGHDSLHLLQEALGHFEEAIVEREKHKFLDSKVARRQNVDHAREKVVEVVVKLVTDEKMKHA